MIWYDEQLTDQLKIVGEVGNNYIHLYLESDGHIKTIKKLFHSDADNIPMDDIREKYMNVIYRYVKKNPEQLELLRVRVINGGIS